MPGLNTLLNYANNVRLFGRNARLYLLHLTISGIALGIYALLFNFYALELGHDEAQLGRLLTANSTAALVAALPAGYLSDRLGRKGALLLSGLITVPAILGMLIWQGAAGLLAMSMLLGIGQSLGAVTFAPFLMENSGQRERTYLFSFSFSLQMLAGTIGFWAGGRMPGWLAGSNLSGDYAKTMVTVSLLICLGLVPLLFLRSPTGRRERAQTFLAPFAYARQQPVLLVKLTSPVLVTALAAGLFVPFMNIFFRHRYNIDDATIGSLFAAASLLMGLGFLLAAPLADRLGKIKLVVLTQILFIPSLLLLGFAPRFWLSAAAYLVRVVLMTMDDPVYQAFVMEQVEERARAMVASLLSMAWSLGWAAGPAISGWMQVGRGFTPVFLSAAGAYLVAIYLTLRFFRRSVRPVDLSSPTLAT